MTKFDRNMTIIHLCHTVTSVSQLGKPKVLTGGVPREVKDTKAAEGHRRKLIAEFEIIGSSLAMVYPMSIAVNIGAEMLGFSLLLVSSG